MLQNDKAFAFLPGFLAVIGIVMRGSKATFSGRSAAFSSLAILITQKFYFANLKKKQCSFRPNQLF